MTATDDEKYLQTAIELAMRGRGSVEPNPMVGCVIVKDGRIIGQGYHGRYGSAHAEPNALASCNESPAGASAYATLEPCCHTDKQTPPCVPRLIEAKIARVVVGCLDPNPKVSGRGIQLLRDAGITVDVGVCGDACRQLIAPFAAQWASDHPYVTLKWAQSADGKIAGPGGKRLQITGPAAQRAIHELRGRCDAIVVGIGTVIADDPLLTVRDVSSMRTPVRVVFDTNARLPLTSRLVKTARETPVAVFNCLALEPRLTELIRAGVHCYCVPRMGQHLDPHYALGEIWWKFKAAHVLVEAGPTLAQELLRLKMVDRIWRFQSRTILAGGTSPSAPQIPPDAIATGRCQLGDDALTEYLISTSPTFAAHVPSADFHLLSQATFPDQPGYNHGT